MESETKTANLRSEATDEALKKESEKLSLLDKIYYTVMIINVLWVIILTGSIIAEHLFK